MNVYDFLDVEAQKDEQVLTATFYPFKPKHTNSQPLDGGTEFSYNIIDDQSGNYRNIINNLVGDQTEQIIRTNCDLPFKINSFIATQDGLFWTVTAIRKKIENSQTKEALRFMKETAQTEYFLKLLQIENPWGLQ